MKVAVFSTKSFDREYFEKFNNPEVHQLTYYEAPLNVDTTNLAVGYEVVSIFVNDKADRETIKRLASTGVRLIALRCAGYNNVDVNAAMANDIKVVRVPSYSPHAVAEHALALILTLNRKTHKAFNRIREGNFSLERLTGFDLYGKTVGVIGTGLIGSIFCRIMQGFGCKVLAYDMHESEDLKEAGVAYQPLDTIFSSSEIISLHCPLTQDTYHLIDTEEYDKMKEGVMLINTSRGGLISTEATIEALKSGKLGYLGIDVYEQEEHLFFKDLSESIILDDLISRLLSFPNVLITAHQGFFTREALEEITTTTLHNITLYAEGKALENQVGE